MNEQPTEDRAEEFQEQIAAMRTKTGRTSSEQILLVIGILLMLAGIVLGFISYFSSTNTDKALDQNELIILAISGGEPFALGRGDLPALFHRSLPALLAAPPDLRKQRQI